MTMRMNYRTFSLGAMAWALLVAIAPAFAATEAEPTHDGNVVSIFGEKLVMTTDRRRGAVPHIGRRRQTDPGRETLRRRPT